MFEIEIIDRDVHKTNQNILMIIHEYSHWKVYKS